MTILTESGIRPSRIEFVPEAGQQGVTPRNPEWRRLSNRVTNFEPELGPEMVEKAGLGEYVHNLEPGPEENETTIEYDLNQWFYDADGNPNDLAGYGLVRTANVLPDSVSVVERMTSGDTEGGVLMGSGSTVEFDYHGTRDATRREGRIYTVLKGCDVGELTITAEIEDVTWHVEATLPSEEGRSYQIDQPLNATTLVVSSDDERDTSPIGDDGELIVVIEGDDAEQREEVTLSGTEAVATTTAFDSIDAIEVLDENGNVADHYGNIVVGVNGSDVDDGGDGGDGTTEEQTADDDAQTEADDSAEAEAEDEDEDEELVTDGGVVDGDTLCVLYGRNEYGNTHGDSGIPTLGTGSRSEPLSDDNFYRAANVSLERPAGTPFEIVGSVQSVELAIDNDIERTPRQRSRSMRQHHGMLEPTLSVTADGESISHRQLQARMTAEEVDTVVGFDTAGDERVTFRNAIVTESGRTREAEDVGAEQEFEIRATPPGLEITPASS